MPTPSSAPETGATAEDRRLHPLSWLFVLLQQLRSFAVPLVLLLVSGRRSATGEWYGLIGVGVLTLMSVAQYLTYRYRPGTDGFVIRSGVLQRTSRDIPYERIHTVNLHQTLLHRLFGVTEVRLESAGSKDAEAVMRVLSIEDARALETFVRDRAAARRAGADTGASDVATVAPPEVALLTLGTPELVRLGLISNRGMVVVAAIFGVAWQFFGEGRIASDTVPEAVLTIGDDARRYVTEHLHDAVGLVASGLVVILLLLVVVRALSVLLAILQYYGFTLVEMGRQLRVERGLLTRVRNQLPLRRIQAWRIEETFLHRWFGRRGLRVDSAAGHDGDDRGVRHLAPIATPEAIDTLLRRLRPGDTWPPPEWHALHPRAWRRMFVVPSMIVAIVAAATVWRLGPFGLLPLLAIPLLIVRARGTARFSGYALTPRAMLVRTGWLSRQWMIVDVGKVQALRLTQSPFDRRHDMATLWLDTAGAGAADGVMRIRYLPTETARALHDRIGSEIDT